MSKKIGILLAIFCLVIPMGLTAKVLDFNIGATAQYKLKADDAGEIDTEYLLDIENYSFGAEAKVKFLFVEVADTALIGSDGSDGWKVSNLMTAGISFDFLNLIRVGVGLGPEFEINFKSDGKILDDAGDPFKFTDIFMRAKGTYRANVDFLLGGITLSANYTVPSAGFSIQKIVDKNFVVNDLLPDDFKDGRFGVSVLISLF